MTRRYDIMTTSTHETIETIMAHIKSIADTMGTAAAQGDFKGVRDAYDALTEALKDGATKNGSGSRDIGSRDIGSSITSYKRDESVPQVTAFDKTRDYQRHVRTKAEELAIICNGLGIPFYATFCIQNDDSKTTYQNISGEPGVRNLDLGRDLIRAHELVQIGFEPCPPRTCTDELFLEDEEEDEDTFLF